MKKLFQSAVRSLEKKEDLVLAVIIERKGSTPRGEGAAMLVGADGRIGGTIGGGAIEYHAQRMAEKLIEEKHCAVEHFYLKPNEVQELGLVCGGDVTVAFCYLKADMYSITLLEEALRLYEKDEEFWMILDTGSKENIKISFYSKMDGIKGSVVPSEVKEYLKDKPVLTDIQGETYFTWKLKNLSRVYIFGGGHVSQALVPVLAAVDFKCTVLEDREEFGRKELFPDAEDVKLIDIRNIAAAVQITAHDFVCIMTRGHKDDLEVQAQVLKTEACYIGVIGSRRKKAAVFSKLKERGFTDADLDRVITPIGLDIGAETPAEIAVSIAAEMIKKRSEM